MNNNITSCEPPKLNEEPNQLPVSCKRWIPDNEIGECQVCLKPFSFLVRKHHCRCCGRIICSECSKNSMRFSDLPRSERVCYPCFNENQQRINRSIYFIIIIIILLLLLFISPIFIDCIYE